MIAPRPNCFSICEMAASTARPRSPLRWVGVWVSAGATGASMIAWAPSLFTPGWRLRSSLLAGFAARLALLLDHLDRHRLIEGRCRLDLRRLVLRLALLLVARSIAAFGHLAGPPDMGAVEVLRAWRRGPYRPVTGGLCDLVPEPSYWAMTASRSV